MDFLESILIAVGLAMDAFTVSVCKGLSMKRMSWKKASVIALYFGFFQMFMPTVGYIIGTSFSDLLEKVDHWVAFLLLVFIGGKMIKEAFSKGNNLNDKIDFNTMIILALATSVDALAVGVTYAFLEASNIMFSFFLIGTTTFVISLIGVKIGNKFGNKYGNKAEFVGGLILIFIGFKILMEHTIFK